MSKSLMILKISLDTKKRLLFLFFNTQVNIDICILHKKEKPKTI